ncbi:MAG: YdeI/OmpD-associated family protein [Cyclobacteriaceae bacterium]
MKNHPKVDDYVAKHQKWQKELRLLRKVVRSTGLEETFKWALPTYMYAGKNLIGLGATKSYVGVWFFQGGLLKDTKKVLVNAQEGKTKAMRQWRFESVMEIDEKLLKAYIEEAISNQKAGKAIKPDRNNKPLVIPDELNQALKANTNLSKHFEQLSLSCKREYAEYIAEAKRAETKIRRLVKIEAMIIDGKGLNDKYKK